MKTVVFVTALLLTNLVFASEALPDCREPISFAFFHVNYFYFDGQGIDVDLLSDITTRTGCRFVIKELPRARTWVALKVGTLAMAGSAVETEERRNFAWFIPYLRMKNVAVSMSSNSQISDLASIRDDPAIKIGRVRALHLGPAIEALIASIAAQSPDRIVEVGDQLGLFKMLQSNRVQVVFAQPPAYQFAAQKLGLKDFVLTDIAPQEGPISHNLVLSKQKFSEQDAMAWRGLLLAMSQDGSLRAILARYLPEAEVDQFLIMP